MQEHSLFRAALVAYDAVTHCATVSLLDSPTASLAGVPCSEQCDSADLTAGKRCLVLIAPDSQALLIATW